MPTSELPEGVDEDLAGRAVAASEGTSQHSVGTLIDACAIDLPPNDVVESIEFERFFILKATLADAQGPLTMMSAWASMKEEDLSREEINELGLESAFRAPLSNKRSDWNHLKAARDAMQAKVEKHAREAKWTKTERAI